MPPRNFCDIDSKYYLFGKSDTPEEKVRQWMIFELLAVYNVPVQAISVESPVKVGTRQHRADILLLKDYRPWAVIECKRQEDSDISSGIQQAVSYASCLQAEFAAFTNGKNWLVKRCRSDQWISVPDLPIYASKNHSSIQLDQLSKAYSSIVLLVRWIHCSFPEDDLSGRELLLDALDHLSRFICSLFLLDNHSRITSLSNLLRDIIRFFRDLNLIDPPYNTERIHKDHLNFFIEIFISIINYHRKTNADLEVEVEKNFLDSLAIRGAVFLSVDDVVKHFQNKPNDLLIDPFDCFSLYIFQINQSCKNLYDIESLMIKLIYQINSHFEYEIAARSKSPILTSNLELTLSLTELVRFIFENQLLITFPNILTFEEVDKIYLDSKKITDLVNKYTPSLSESDIARIWQDFHQQYDS